MEFEGARVRRSHRTLGGKLSLNLEARYPMDGHHYFIEKKKDRMLATGILLSYVPTSGH